jgi:hypothetical protein
VFAFLAMSETPKIVPPDVSLNYTVRRRQTGSETPLIKSGVSLGGLKIIDQIALEYHEIQKEELQQYLYLFGLFDVQKTGLLTDSQVTALMRTLSPPFSTVSRRAIFGIIEDMSEDELESYSLNAEDFLHVMVKVKQTKGGNFVKKQNSRIYQRSG